MAQQSATTNRLQAISPVNSRVVWASGVGGTFVRTLDGGRTWQAGVVAGAEALEFRDIRRGAAQSIAFRTSGFLRSTDHLDLYFLQENHFTVV